MDNKCTHPKTVKNGKDKHRRQRYKCTNCGKSFTDESIENPELRRKKRMVTHLLLLGYSPGQIKSAIAVSESEIELWSKKYIPKLKDLQRSGKPLKVKLAYEFLSKLDEGKLPLTTNENNRTTLKSKVRPKKSTRKK